MPAAPLTGTEHHPHAGGFVRRQPVVAGRDRGEEDLVLALQPVGRVSTAGQAPAAGVKKAIEVEFAAVGELLGAKAVSFK